VRPLRLCDIALLLDTLSEMQEEPFDRDYCLRGSRQEVEQIIVTLLLAHDLLGATIGDIPVTVRDRRLPSWLGSTVIRQWENNPTVPGPVLSEIWTDPGGIVRSLCRRWPNHITATLRTGAPFNEFPRLPVQWVAYLRQIAISITLGLPSQLSRASVRCRKMGEVKACTWRINRAAMWAASVIRPASRREEDAFS
jgi:hypothetical protein